MRVADEALRTVRSLATGYFLFAEAHAAGHIQSQRGYCKQTLCSGVSERNPSVNPDAHRVGDRAARIMYKLMALHETLEYVCEAGERRSGSALVWLSACLPRGPGVLLL